MVSYFGIIIRHFFWKNWNPAKWVLLTTRFHEIEILLVTSSLSSFAFKQYSTSWVVVKGPVVSHLVFQALTQTLNVSHFRGQFFFFFFRWMYEKLYGISRVLWRLHYSAVAADIVPYATTTRRSCTSVGLSGLGRKRCLNSASHERMISFCFLSFFFFLFFP